MVNDTQHQPPPPKRTRVYTDGIYDLFHRGHLESLRKCSLLFDQTTLIVGVIDDATATAYKRAPIYCEDDRYEIIEHIQFVDSLIRNAPLVITREFMEEHDIDFVVHGFSNAQDKDKQDEFYEFPKSVGKFMEIEYFPLISTTEILHRISLLTTTTTTK